MATYQQWCQTSEYMEHCLFGLSSISMILKAHRIRMSGDIDNLVSQAISSEVYTFDDFQEHFHIILEVRLSRCIY